MTKQEIITWLSQMLKPIDPEGKWVIDLKSAKKRSRNANSYYWVLVGKITAQMRVADPTITEEDVHLHMLKSYGCTKKDRDGNPVIFAVKNGIDFADAYRYVEIVMVGSTFTEWRALTGSSEMDMHEMSALIGGCVQEAKTLGIETLTPNQLHEMIERWVPNGTKEDV